MRPHTKICQVSPIALLFLFLFFLKKKSTSKYYDMEHQGPKQIQPNKNRATCYPAQMLCIKTVDGNRTGALEQRT